MGSKEAEVAKDPTQEAAGHFPLHSSETEKTKARKADAGSRK